jgi:hypothetical protein
MHTSKAAKQIEPNKVYMFVSFIMKETIYKISTCGKHSFILNKQTSLSFNKGQ